MLASSRAAPDTALVVLLLPPVGALVVVPPDRQSAEQVVRRHGDPRHPGAAGLGGGQLCLSPGHDGKVSHLAQRGEGLTPEPTCFESLDIAHVPDDVI